MRDLYQRELNELKKNFDLMLHLCLETLKKSIEWKALDLNEIAQLIARLSIMEKELYHTSEMLILKQQPVADDLEFLMGVLRKAPELRRIGELSLNSAKIIVESPKTAEIDLLGEMRALLLSMFLALQQKDGALLEELEEQTDSCFKQMQVKIAQELEKDPQDARAWLLILMLSKYFEKIADHIVAVYYG